MPSFEMEFCDTLFASWEADPNSVSRRIPDPLEVDTFDGTAYLSVVPFFLKNIRPKGLPSAFGLSAPELNLRTYVTHDEVGSGVYFFSLDVGSLIGAIGGRVFNRIPYYYADMEYSSENGTVEFESHRHTPGTRPNRFKAVYRPSPRPVSVETSQAEEAESGSLDCFLAERYRYFTHTQDGEIGYAEIRHDPWKLRPAEWELNRSQIFESNGFTRPNSSPHMIIGEEIHVTSSEVRTL